MSPVEPSPERMKFLVENAEDDSPIVMINLLRYREQAQYAVDSGVAPCSGREAYQRYGAVATQHVQGVGGRMLWAGAVHASPIAPPDEAWDDAVIVEYPSRLAFRTMLGKPDYQKATFHRTAALEDSRLIATTTRANFL